MLGLLNDRSKYTTLTYVAEQLGDRVHLTGGWADDRFGDICEERLVYGLNMYAEDAQGFVIEGSIEITVFSSDAHPQTRMIGVGALRQPYVAVTCERDFDWIARAYAFRNVDPEHVHVAKAIQWPMRTLTIMIRTEEN